MRAIDADLLEPDAGYDDGEFWAYSKTQIDNAPTITPERKKGKWLANGDIPKECSFCGEDWDKYVFGDIWYTGELPKYCPNCGADMRGEQDEQTD